MVLLGSSPFLLQKGLSESLLGRYLEMPVYHWSYVEMRDAFGLSVDELIYHGGYPGAAQLLSFAKILKQLQGGDQELLVDYLDVLERVWMITGLWNYSHHPVHKKVPPKFQVLNTALMSYAHGYSFEQARSHGSHWGRLVESAVGAHILNSYDDVNMSLSHWRRNGDEVDFVVRKGPSLVVIEVKSGVQARSNSALLRFHKRYP